MKLRVSLIAFFFTTMLSAQENNPGFKPYTQKIPGTPVSFNLVPIPGFWIDNMRVLFTVMFNILIHVS